MTVPYLLPIPIDQSTIPMNSTGNAEEDTEAGPIFDATTDYWQETLTENELPISPNPPYQRGYPARLPDGRFLILPLRAIPDSPTQCVASLQASHASFQDIQL